MPGAPVAAVRLSAAPRSAAKTRILTAALELFGEHGVSGTSLQMIADAIGVTKAAVYHQYNTKDEIVLAVAEDQLVWLEAALDAGEAEGRRPQAIDVLLGQVIDIAIAHRSWVSILQSDPVVVRLLGEHEPFQQLMERLYRLLTGDLRGAQARVGAAMLTAAIGGAVIHPFVIGLDDETLRTELLRFSRRLLDTSS
jgi:AcrR family transcriptional regulator